MSCGCVRQAAIAGGVTAAAPTEMLLFRTNSLLPAELLLLQQKWKSWYQKLQQILNFKFQLLHIHIRIPKL